MYAIESLTLYVVLSECIHLKQIQACWAMFGRVYFVKAGHIEHMLLPKGPAKGEKTEAQHKSLALRPTDLMVKESIEASWIIGNM